VKLGDMQFTTKIGVLGKSMMLRQVTTVGPS